MTTANLITVKLITAQLITAKLITAKLRQAPAVPTGPAQLRARAGSFHQPDHPGERTRDGLGHDCCKFLGSSNVSSVRLEFGVVEHRLEIEFDPEGSLRAARARRKK